MTGFLNFIKSLIELFAEAIVETLKLYFALDGIQTDIIAKILGIPAIVFTISGIIIFAAKRIIRWIN